VERGRDEQDQQHVHGRVARRLDELAQPREQLRRLSRQL
jgi:hypothetical protein